MIDRMLKSSMLFLFNADGVGTASDILQDEHYYPFGLRISDPRRSAGNPANRYQYNGKEWSEESGLGWYAYGARWYDPAVGRWWSVDPKADMYFGFSTYHAVLNNPIRLIDVNGMSAVDYIFLDNNGNEIHRIRDPYIKHVTFISDENKLQQLLYWKEKDAFFPLNSPGYLEALGNTYDMNGVLNIFDESAKDLVNSGKILDSENGTPRFDIANEHGAILEIKNNGIIGIGLRNTDNSPINTGYKKRKSEYDDNEVSVMHTHPNEGKRAVNHGRLRTYNRDNGPSPRDKINADGQAKSGYYNIVIDKNKVYFYNSNKVISIFLNNL
jgi:RHS repeat-associated protein